MDAIIFIGLQASGKSTFYHQRFADSHLRINLDMLKTRHRERILIDACHNAKQSYVVDNTNPARQDRARYIPEAQERGFEVTGYYFSSSLEACMRRNAARPASSVVPLPGLMGTYNRIELPSLDEGFGRLYYVRNIDNGFEVEEWTDEV